MLAACSGAAAAGSTQTSAVLHLNCAASGRCPLLSVTASPARGAVSSLQRSAVLINPDVPEAVALRQWYDSSGRGAAMSHVGEGLATALK